MSTLYYVENGHVSEANNTPVVDPLPADEIAQKYNIIESGEGYGIAVPIRFATEAKPELDTQASSRARTAYGEDLTQDYNPEFNFPENLRRYREMRMDAEVRSALRIAKSPVLAARWFMQPATNRKSDVRRAEYIWKNITQWMSTSWPQLLIEMLYMLDYGFYVMELVFTKGPDGLIRWKKWVPIHPLTIISTDYDDDGGYAGVTVSVENSAGGVDEVPIPIEKLLVFTYDKEAGMMEGQSALRSVYKHWFIKENLLKIDAIQKERHSIGVPIIVLPIGYNPRDVQAAHQIGRDLRGNESAHVVLPPNWEIHFAKLEGNNVEPIKSIEYHGRKIYENFLVNFMDSNVSTRHVGGHDETFMKGTRFIAEVIRDIINKYAVPQLYDWNWGEPTTGYPELKVRRLGDTTDWRTMSFSHRNYVGAKILTPDDELEDWVREEMDLPMRDPDTAREADSPQARVGPPRQSPPSAGTGNANAGRDRSGE